MHGIGIDNRPIVYTLADGDGFQCSSSTASSDDYDDEPLLNTSLHASECTRMHLRTPKISWGTMPPDPTRLNDCRAAMFSTSANTPLPRWKKLCMALFSCTLIAVSPLHTTLSTKEVFGFWIVHRDRGLICFQKQHGDNTMHQLSRGCQFAYWYIAIHLTFLAVPFASTWRTISLYVAIWLQR